MKSVALVAITVIGAVLFAGPRLQGNLTEPKPAQEAPGPSGAPSKKVPVYVTNFELDVVPFLPSPRPVVPASNPSQPDAKPQLLDPGQLARQVVDTMATKLVTALQNAGYPAHRLRPGDGRPDYGVQIRGIFTEVDSQNHWTRAVIRSGSDNGKVSVMVAVGNLARPDQALYEIANLPGNTNRPGAIITLSPYVPLERFELTKDADEKAFAGIASRVVADLDALVSKNNAALPD
jgi:Domain of unknown function (DUF4410)